LQSTLLPPAGAAPPARFGLHLDGAVWGGWVRQSSPACAAACVAGAWNALAAGGRHCKGAITQDDVVVGVHTVCVPCAIL